MFSVSNHSTIDAKTNVKFVTEKTRKPIKAIVDLVTIYILNQRWQVNIQKAATKSREI